jgi:hypothetical protein
MSVSSWLGRHRGHLLDVLVFLANLFLFGAVARWLGKLGAGFTANDDAAARQLAFIILAAFTSYTVGAMLKRAPLHARRKSLPSPGYAGCLFLGWISLSLSLSIFGAAIVAVGFEHAPKGVPLALVILLSLLPTVFAARVVFPPKKVEQIPAWRKSWPMELLADIMIVAAVLLLTIMWNMWFADLFVFDSPGLGLTEKMFAAGLAAAAFALFYVTPRFLFLIEDFNRWPTWVTIGLTLAPVIGRILLSGAPAR